MKKTILERFSKSNCVKNPHKFPRNNKKFSWSEDDNNAPRSMSKLRRIANCSDREYLPSDTTAFARFLESRLGDSWDEIYSDICASVDSRNGLGNRFHQSIGWMVEKEVFLSKTGGLCDKHGHELGGFFDEFYIHPMTGKLERAEKIRYRTPTQQQTVFEMDKVLYHKHDGLWYRVEMKPIPVIDRTVRYFVDVLDPYLASWYTTSSHSWRATKKYGVAPDGKAWYCHAKQSANSKEIAALRKKYKLED